MGWSAPECGKGIGGAGGETCMFARGVYTTSLLPRARRRPWQALSRFQFHARIAQKGAVMAYLLEGKLLEVCTCRAVCPCWVGEDPDGGKCEGTMAWHIEKGQVEGLDVSGIAGCMLAPERSGFQRAPVRSSATGPVR